MDRATYKLYVALVTSRGRKSFEVRANCSKSSDQSQSKGASSKFNDNDDL